MFLALLLAAACGPLAQPVAIEKLKPAADGRYCTHDRAWCVALRSDGQAMDVFDGNVEPRSLVATVPTPMSDTEAMTAAWTSIVRLASSDEADVALVGLTQTERQMYSGGGSSVTQLTLYEVRHGASPRRVLQMPLSASISIRACFTEADEARRLGACHDEHRYRAVLSPDPSGAPARMIFESYAETFPGRRSRTVDSTAAPPLRPRDLQIATDPECSVTRTLTRNDRTGDFEWDRPLPTCPDFLEP